MRRPARALAISLVVALRCATLLLALSLAVPLPAWAGWTKQANGQWTGLSYLHCLPWSTNGTYCYDEAATSGTAEIVRVLPDYTVARYDGPTFPTGGAPVGLGTSSAGLSLQYNRSNCRIDSYYTSSATASSWTAAFTDFSTNGGGVMLGPAWGPSDVLVSIRNDSGWNPPRWVGSRWTTGAITDGGYGTINPFPFCGGRAIGSGCPRTSSNWDWVLGWNWGAQYDFVYGSVNSSYATTGLSGRISWDGQITGSSGCASDGSTSVLGLRRLGAGKSYIIQQGAVTTTQAYTTDLIVGYAGTALTGSAARFAISVDGAMWTATSGAFADASGTSLDITLDASDKVSGFGLAPDGATPMVVTKEGDVWTWAAASTTRPRRSTLSGSLGGTMRGGL